MSIASIKTFCSMWFNRAMTEPDINSRFVFLLSGIGSAVATLTLVVAFIVAKDKTGYDYMVMAVGGGAVGHGINRYLTKKTVDADDKKDGQ